MTDPAPPDAAAIIRARLKELWRTSLPTILERMAVLHEALKTLTDSPADSEARSQGREAAHKLAGILGVFDLPQGSELASEIENLLIDPSDRQPNRQPAALSRKDLNALRSRITELDEIIASKPAS